MNTFELLIVFAALMAVISLVAIAIDWVGRPLRHRRFIPRIYRYEDELSAAPIDPRSRSARGVPMAVHMHPGATATAPADGAAHAVRSPQPTVVATLDGGATAARPVFSEAAQTAIATSPTRTPDGVAQTVPQAPAPSWQPGMALDARAGDRKPTAAVKAERFWRAVAATMAPDTHFDASNRDQMAAGRPPTRHNPRTGEVEAMELLGLRAAATEADVGMRWPGDAIDPWERS